MIGKHTAVTIVDGEESIGLLVFLVGVELEDGNMRVFHACDRTGIRVHSTMPRSVLAEAAALSHIKT